MKWEKVKLGEITESCLGKMLDQNKNKGTYQKYLANVNVRWGSFDLDNLAEMRFEDDETERYGVRYGDLIVCEGGEPGRCAIWKDEVPNMKIQKALHRVRVLPEKADAFYLLYWFMYAGQRKELEQYFTGATIKHMPGDKLKQVVVVLPDLPTQRRIASILSAYDDLIENNRRQIKLLEEAAQRLYREWFVELRFPGHEDVKIVDGVPEGWKVMSMNDIAEYVNGYAFKPSDWGSKGKPIIKIKEMGAGVTTDTPRNSGEGIPEKYIVTSGDILFSWSATLSAVIWDQEDGLLNQHLFKVVPSGNIAREFVFQSILHTLNEFYNLTTGSTMKHIQRGKLNEVFVNVPDYGIMKKYESVSSPMREEILILRKRMTLLREARDRLIPKMMSGEREV